MYRNHSSHKPAIADPAIRAAGSILISIALAIVVPMSAVADTYQVRQLLDPGAAAMQAEARGLVTIYDGIRLSTINVAMDKHFGRIENMMFVRTINDTIEIGPETEDDCD